MTKNPVLGETRPSETRRTGRVTRAVGSASSGSPDRAAAQLLEELKNGQQAALLLAQRADLQTKH